MNKKSPAVAALLTPMLFPDKSGPPEGTVLQKCRPCRILNKLQQQRNHFFQQGIRRMKSRWILGAAALAMLSGVTLTAARYDKLGSYIDVEVIDITWRGIEIVHRDGSCRLTEAELSDEDKARLKNELEKLHELQAEQQKLWKAHQEQLAKEKKIADQQARSVTNVMNQARKNKDINRRIAMLMDARKKYPKASNMAALVKMITTQQGVAVTEAMNRAKKEGNLNKRLNILLSAQKRYPYASNRGALKQLISKTRKDKQAADAKAKKAAEEAKKKQQ